jgi:hypothetical protein
MHGRDSILVLGWTILPGCLYFDNPNVSDAVGEEESGWTTDTENSTTQSEGDGDPDGDPGDGDPGDGDGLSPEAPVFELSLSQAKQFDFDWMPALGAQYYQLFESIDMGEPYVQVGDDLLGLATSLTVPLHFRLNASYKLRACNENGCTDSEAVDVVGPLVEAIGYFKASNTHANDNFGISVALSGDGNTLAVGAYREDSSAKGIGGNQTNDSAPDAGAVYVFVRDDQNAWWQQAYIKGSNTAAGDEFGISVALSDDGDTLAVGADGESSIATGIDGYQFDNSADGSGAAYVFVRDGQNTWSQQAYVKASNTDGFDYFGGSVALSGDGDTLAVGAVAEDSSATEIDGNQDDNSAPSAGSVYVFVRDGQNAWSQQAYVKASNTDAGDGFGGNVALSGDGATLAVGASGKDSSAGGVYVFMRDGQNWSQRAYIKAFNIDAEDSFGANVALSGDGKTLAVGAYREDSSAAGIWGNSDNASPNSGAVYVFVHTGQNQWSHQAYVKASNTSGDNCFGWSVALSESGDTMAVGAYGEASSAMGVGGNQANDGADWTGAAYVFVRNDQKQWSQKAYIKASNPAAGDRFGYGVALSGDGYTLVASAVGEASAATGIGGTQADNSAVQAGAVYLY